MKKIIKLTLTIFVLLALALPITASAQEILPEPTEEQKKAASDTTPQWDCPVDNITGEECVTDNERKENVVSELQEAMGSEDETTGTGKIRQCVRVTMKGKCELKKKEKTEYQERTFTRLIKGKTCPGDAISCERITVLISKGGVGEIQLYIGMIYRWAATLAGIVCVLIMIVSGIQMSAASGDQAAVDSAKKRIFQALTGLVVLFLSAFILYIINPGFFTK